MTDKFTDGSTIRLFESGGIMQYLVDKYDPDHKVSYPHGSKEYYEVNNWVRLKKATVEAPVLADTRSKISCSGRWAGSDQCRVKLTTSPDMPQRKLNTE